MADVKDLMPDLDRLDGQIDDLEENLQPLLDNLQEMSSQLPLLDKAKLFSLTAYAIETLLFCMYTLSSLFTLILLRMLTMTSSPSFSQTGRGRCSEPRSLR